MTRIFEDGFESGALNSWTGTSIGGTSTISIQSTPHKGVYGLQIFSNNPNANNAYVYKTIASIATVYARAYVYFNNIDTTASKHVNLLALNTGGNGTQIVEAQLYSDGGNPVFSLRLGAGTYVGAMTVVTGRWYCIEIMVTISATVGAAQLWVDAVSIQSLANQNTGTTNIATVQVGADNNTSNSPADWTMYFDDVVVADGYIGPEISNRATRIAVQRRGIP